MTSSRLNLSALRGYLAASPGPGSRSLSRRQMLGVTGGAAVGTSPALKAIGSALHNSFELKGDRRRLAFTLGGHEYWVIDTRRFAGSPALTVDRREHSIRVELSGARYPGTSLPADLICELRAGLTGWRMTLKMALGGFQAVVPLEKWLRGTHIARSNVTLRPAASTLGTGTRLTLQGRARATFVPTWELHLDGAQAGHLAGMGSELISDHVTLELLTPDSPSILKKPLARRTAISLERGRHSWRFEVARRAGTNWKLRTSANPFDTIRVELGETRLGTTHCALLATTQAQDARLFFQPAGKLAGGAGKAFALPLTQTRYAVSFDPSGDEIAIAARYEHSVWLRGEACAVELGDGPDIEPFELVSRPGAADRVRCAPALVSVAIPLDGAIVTPTPTTGRGRLAFVADTADRAHNDHVANIGWLRLPGVNRRLTALLTVSNPTAAVLRPQDLLAVTFVFDNLTLNTATGQPPTLTVTDTSQDAHVRVVFPPQHILEQTYHETTSEYPAGTAQSVSANPSQLVFIVPRASTPIPYTLASLLNWNQWTMSVPGDALPPGGLPDYVYASDFPFASPVQPGPNQTALELPYGLIMSPPNRLDLAGTNLPYWAHSTNEVTHGGRTELWHTRLAGKSVDAHGTPIITESPDNTLLTMRAVWASGFDTTTHTADDPGFTAPLTGTLRYDLVELMGDFSNFSPTTFIPGHPQFVPAPATVDRLMLTALGAWFNVHGSWDDPDISVTEWNHQATMGRDHYVKVVQRGFLFPFGHRALKVTVTERKIKEVNNAGNRVALLEQNIFIIVLQHDKTYTISDYPPTWDSNPASHARKMPFKAIHITTQVTPPLVDPPLNVPVPAVGGSGPCGGAGQPVCLVPGTAFWPQVIDPNGATANFPFHCIAEDITGQRTEFGASLIFVTIPDAPNQTLPYDANCMSQLLLAYGNGPLGAATSPFFGQHLALAEASTVAGAGDQNLEATSVTFGGDVPPQGVALPAGQFRIYPTLDHAMVHIPAVKQLVGQDKEVKVVYHQTYLQSGLDHSLNTGQVYLDLPDKLPLTYGGSGQAPTSPGVITPNLSVTALSQTAGLVGGNAANFATGTFNPTDFFGGLFGNDSPKLLGGIHLSEILTALTGASDPTQLAGAAPQLIRQQLPQNVPPEVAVMVHWTAPTNADSTGIFKPDNTPGDPLVIDGKSRTFLDGVTPPSFEITGKLTAFSLNLAIVSIPFESFTFHVKDGQKMDVKPVLGDVQFLPPLSFVQTLESYLSSVLGGGTYLDLEPTYVTGGFSIALPSIGAGMFDLMNISLGAGITVPFTGEPVRARFDFCTKEHPFLLAISLIAGTGWLSLAVGPDGIEALDASFEVGAILAIDLFIAAGEIHVFIGIYFHWGKDDTGKEDASLTGYVRLGGEVSVMGLISISIDFRLGVKYDITMGDLYGRAELQLEVSIAFFSKTFSATVERRIPGPPSSSPTPVDRKLATKLRPAVVQEPVTSQTLSAPEWATYCQAFA